MTTLAHVRRAYEIAQIAHAGQVDLAGVPIIEHVREVALAVAMIHDGYEYEIVAAIHDAAEDSDLTIETIRAEFGDVIADALDAITQRPREPYFEYLDRCCANKIARAVKYHDNAHNACPHRIAAIPCEAKQARLVRKYQRARAVIMEAA